MILYLHGFCSSSRSWKARLLAEAMQARGLGDRWACPDLPPAPRQAVDLAESILADAREPVTLVGSSLGGHYATWLAEKHGLRAVLINPAVVDRIGPGRFVGEHANFHDGSRFLFTAEHAAQLAGQCVARPDPARYWLLVERGDEVLDYRDAVARYAGCRQSVLPGGDHSFIQFPEYIPQIIEFARL